MRNDTRGGLTPDPAGQHDRPAVAHADRQRRAPILGRQGADDERACLGDDQLAVNAAVRPTLLQFEEELVQNRPFLPVMTCNSGRAG